jgi:hypothetical protein
VEAFMRQVIPTYEERQARLRVVEG